MMYDKERKGLNQVQAFDNLKVMLGLEYFGKFDLEEAKFTSETLSADIRGTYGLQRRTKIGDISGQYLGLMGSAIERGSISNVYVMMRASTEFLKSMNFEDRLYDEDFSLPLIVNIRPDGVSSDELYRYVVLNLGFKESFFESEGLDYQDATEKLSSWYEEITKNLEKLPHKLG